MRVSTIWNSVGAGFGLPAPDVVVFLGSAGEGRRRGRPRPGPGHAGRAAANFNQLVTPCQRKIDAARPVYYVRADVGASSPPRRSLFFAGQYSAYPSPCPPATAI